MTHILLLKKCYQNIIVLVDRIYVYGKKKFNYTFKFSFLFPFFLLPSYDFPFCTL